MDNFQIYTDGGSRGNPGQGACGFVVYKNDSTEYESVKYFQNNVTNGQMEVRAMLDALYYIKNKIPIESEITIFTDSNYVLNGITSWMFNWVRDETVYTRPNGELWLEIYRLGKVELSGHNIQFKKVKAHSGDLGNERIDSLLNKAMDNKTDIELDVNSELTKLPTDPMVLPIANDSTKLIKVMEVTKVMRLDDESISLVIPMDLNPNKVQELVINIKKEVIKDLIKLLNEDVH